TSVTPDCDLGGAAILGLDNLPCNRGGGLLSAALPCPEGPVNIVKAGDECLQTTFSPVFLAEHLRNELLPAVPALGHGRIGVRLREWSNVRIFLQLGIVHTCRRGEKIPLY